MNIERINGLIDHLRELDTKQFDMLSFYSEKYDDEAHVCGTTACLAGYAVIMHEGSKFKGRLSNHIWFDEAMTILGLDRETAYHLFLGQGTHCGATLAEAIRTLEILRDTGKVDWSETVERATREITRQI